MLKFDKKGLIPAVIQNATSGKVLMLGYINKESLEKTLQTGHVWFYSRSRQELWEKGETSGNYLNVRAIFKDCDEDSLLIQVDPAGPTCHTGAESCFYRTLDSDQ
jgi:phosphoribosyl-AMP cyclohydrolase / phosphoribosyl-ATP pyrophosphohydrolase